MSASTPAFVAASATTAFFLGLGLTVGLAAAFLVGLTTTVVIAALVVITDDLGQGAQVSACGDADVVNPAASPRGTDNAERPMRTLGPFIDASDPHQVESEKVCPGCGRIVRARQGQAVRCAMCGTECPPLLAGPWPDVLGPSGSQQPPARSERVSEES